MPTDPRRLRPSELCRLLNSTPLGEVINERQLYRHRTRAGMRIGDGRYVDLLRYAAWLIEQRHKPRPAAAEDPYEAIKERARARNAALSLAGRDIGQLPEVVDPRRKEQATADFRFFCESYFPQTFHLTWSPDHLKVIAKIEKAVIEGGLFAMAMPRGSGKTTVCECACIWAVLNGHREFVCLIGSDEGHAMDMLESIKTELDGNDLLLEDFPEVIYPIQCLDGIAKASSLQQEEKHMDDSNKAVDANQDAATDNNATATPTNTDPKPATKIEAQYDGPSAEQIRAEALAESNRINEIRRHCDGQYSEIEARAIREGWTADRCQAEVALEALRRSRPKAPAAHYRDNTLSGATLEAACLLTAGLERVDQIFDGPTVEAASRRFRGGIGLQELLLEAAWANGYTGRNFRDSRSVLRFAFRPELEAGFSTIDIGGILSNVANKFLLDGFFSVERTWRNICATRNVSDFKTVTSYRLIGADQYEQVAPGGELKHGTLGNEQYTNKADTYGLMLSIDRRDIINDDLGAITTVPRKLGRGSGLKINDIFWATFLNNSTFFSAGNKNYISGADTVLSIDGLTKGEVTFMDQVDPDGKPIGVMPAILLVPTALSAVGSQLYKSMELRDTTASTKYPVSNPHQGKFRVEVSRYLSNSQYTGNSSKAWYLLAEPGDLPVIEVAFLNGQESPTIETADADFSVLGVQMRGYHDFGVGLQDPRGGIKAKGEA